MIEEIRFIIHYKQGTSHVHIYTLYYKRKDWDAWKQSIAFALLCCGWSHYLHHSLRHIHNLKITDHGEQRMWHLLWNHQLISSLAIPLSPLLPWTPNYGAWNKASCSKWVVSCEEQKNKTQNNPHCSCHSELFWKAKQFSELLKVHCCFRKITRRSFFWKWSPFCAPCGSSPFISALKMPIWTKRRKIGTRQTFSHGFLEFRTMTTATDAGNIIIITVVVLDDKTRCLHPSYHVQCAHTHTSSKPNVSCFSPWHSLITHTNVNTRAVLQL